MPTVRLPTTYFPDPDSFATVPLGKVYIGTVDNDPSIEGNRISVTIIDSAGNEVVIPVGSQPFVLNAGGQFTYQGSPVQLRTSSNYSIALYTAQDALVYYFPDAVLGEQVDTSLIKLTARSTPATDSDVAQVYAKVVAGVKEFFILDSNGNEIQITSGGSLNVDLGSDPIETTAEVKGATFLGSNANVTVDAGTAEIDPNLGDTFFITLTADATLNIINADATKTFSIVVYVTTTGAFTFTSIGMSGVQKYIEEGESVGLKANGVTAVGISYNGPNAEAFFFFRNMDTF